MICQVCKQNHLLKNDDKWCDRSNLEIENDYLKAQNDRYREALHIIADQKISGSLVYDASELMIEIAREALKE